MLLISIRQIFEVLRQRLKANFNSYDKSTDKFNLTAFQISFNLCIAH